MAVVKISAMEYAQKNGWDSHVEKPTIGYTFLMNKDLTTPIDIY